MCFARASYEWNLIDNETSYSEKKYKKELNGRERPRESKRKNVREYGREVEIYGIR